jgi:hypothetical protein
MAHKFIDGIPLFVGGVPALADACCCSTSCPCCYYAITIKRGSGSTITVRQNNSFCTITSDFSLPAFQCGDETFVLTPGTSGGCTCYATYSSDTNEYSALPCLQQYYTESALDQVCNYNPPGPGTGVETHVGTMSFRDVFTVTLCYDPCGTVVATINHKVYCNFGVWVHDEPPAIVGPITDTWVDVSTDLVLDSTWTWNKAAPNCTADYDIGTPTSSTLASAYSKTWGTAYSNCGGSSSFTVSIPGACAATGLVLVGGGTPCAC